MYRSRRTVLAALPTLLAGCSRSFRENKVPGGLLIDNGVEQDVTVTVRASLLLSPESPQAGTPESTPETPRKTEFEQPDESGTYDVPASTQKAVPDFFTREGRWAVEAAVEDDGDFGRTRIELHAAIPGPTGADSVIISVDEDGVAAEATNVD